MSDQLLVLTGPMRSGTTVLADLLYAGFERKPRHPDLAFANDHVVNLRDFSSQVSTCASFPRAQMNRDIPEQFACEWLKRAEKQRFIAELKSVIATDCPTPTAPKWFGVKNTCLMPELLLLHRLCGLKAKFIVMIRDPRDCIASYDVRHRKMYKPGDGYEHLAPYLSYMNASFMLDYIRLASEDTPIGKDILFVKYEEMVTNVEPTLTRILHFIDLDPADYDWDSIRSGNVVSNSSYSSAGPNDVEFRCGIRPSIGNFDSTPAEMLSFVDIGLYPVFDQFGYVRDASLPTSNYVSRHTFFDGVEQSSIKYGFAMEGLREVLERDRLYRATKPIWLAKNFANQAAQRIIRRIVR